ncbi:MAG: hypothetical protein AABY22_29260 [Nanoarchaeota archaeon]
MKKIKLKWWEKIYYPLWRKWDWFRNIPDEIKWFIQRGKRGYADSDVWSIDGYLCSWLPSALEKLKNTNHGCPVSDKCKCTRDGNENMKCLFDDYLDKMILGFKSVNDLLNLVYITKKNKNKPKILKAEEDKLQNKFDEGMKLFVKYFQSLWD